MKSLFDEVSRECSRSTTKKYSTSFSAGILFLDKKIRNPIYSIYGFVRLADEIVDSFHDYDKKQLLQNFKEDTYKSIEQKISLNPILNAFQEVYHQYGISKKWLDAFLNSMEMDLEKKEFNEQIYNQYINGSAEAVGLMCLHVFTDRNPILFEELMPYAMKLGAAFQKVNFLRDVRADHQELGRTYFPEVDMNNFSARDKVKIEQDIETDFQEALKGIKMLPRSSRSGVYLAYYYYSILFKKIKKLSPQRILRERIRVPNHIKFLLLIKSQLRHQLNML